MVGGFRGRCVSWSVGFVVGRHWVSLLKSVVGAGFGFGCHWVWSSLGLVLIGFGRHFVCLFGRRRLGVCRSA